MFQRSSLPPSSGRSVKDGGKKKQTGEARQVPLANRKCEQSDPAANAISVRRKN
jgi:hypothetical protein